MCLPVPSRETQTLRPLNHTCPICSFQVLTCRNEETQREHNLCPYCFTNVPRDLHPDAIELRCFQCAHPTCRLAGGRGSGGGPGPGGPPGAGGPPGPSAPPARSSSAPISTLRRPAAAVRPPARQNASNTSGSHAPGGVPGPAAVAELTPATVPYTSAPMPAAATESSAALMVARNGSSATPAVGQELFVCAACGGQGQLTLRQHTDGRWCAQCSRHPACQRIEWLPRCVVAASVDGRCATCSGRFGEVYTMRLQVNSAELVAAVLGGRGDGETTMLDGACAAGCNDALWQRLSA